MTTLILTANYCGRTLNASFEGFKLSLRKILVAFIIGRQMAVNRQVAQHLIHEYPEHTVQSLTVMLNKRVTDSYRK
jgi:hypothetical protein